MPMGMTDAEFCRIYRTSDDPLLREAVERMDKVLDKLSFYMEEDLNCYELRFGKS